MVLQQPIFRDRVGGGGKLTSSAVGFPYVKRVTAGGLVTYQNASGDEETLQLGDTSHASVSVPGIPYQCWGTESEGNEVDWRALPTSFSDLSGGLLANQVNFPYLKSLTVGGSFMYQDASGAEQTSVLALPTSTLTGSLAAS